LRELDEFERHGQPSGAATACFGDPGAVPHGGDARNGTNWGQRVRHSFTMLGYRSDQPCSNWSIAFSAARSSTAV
jgi:hypothetical protein